MGKNKYYLEVWLLLSLIFPLEEKKKAWSLALVHPVWKNCIFIIFLTKWNRFCVRNNHSFETVCKCQCPIGKIVHVYCSWQKSEIHFMTKITDSLKQYVNTNVIPRKLYMYNICGKVKIDFVMVGWLVGCLV